MRTITFTLALLLAQQQTPAQLLQQIIDAAKQLQAQLEPPPPPPTVTTVTTAAELVAAVKAGAPIVEAAAGTYAVNLVVMRPLILRGPREAVLVPVDPLEPALRVNGSDVSVFGISVQGGATDRAALVLGDFTATSVDAYPHRVRFEGVRVFTVAGGHRGMALHGVDVTVNGCEVTGFWEMKRDSQAIWINGPGPYTITNNVLEASGENLLVGGADMGVVGVNPSDLTIRGNTLSKPASFWTNGSQVKNSFELKTGVGVLFEDNVIDGWKPGLHQAPIQITVRNQDGKMPWAKVDDVVIRRTVFQNVVGGFAINIQGTDNEQPSQQTDRVAIDHNLFRGSAALLQVLGGVSKALVVDHNTAPQITTKLLSFDRIAGRPDMVTPLTFTQNVVRTGTYGVTGDGSQGFGLPSLLAYCSLTDWFGNILEATATWTWPVGQTTVPKGSLATLLDPLTFKLLNGTAGY
jgi:hypothetical protein